MHTVTELDILLREGIELPASLRIAKEDFQNGWKFALTANAQELETQVHASGWNLIKIADQLQASGVGETAQEAVASGLRLALLRMNVGNNAAAVESIELTKYPWFELARVKVRPICIQQSATLAVSDDRVSTPVARRTCPGWLHRPHRGDAADGQRAGRHSRRRPRTPAGRPRRWRVRPWRRSSSPAMRSVSPAVTTNYTVTALSDATGCTAGSSPIPTRRHSAGKPWR